MKKIIIIILVVFLSFLFNCKKRDIGKENLPINEIETVNSNK